MRISSSLVVIVSAFSILFAFIAFSPVDGLQTKSDFFVSYLLYQLSFGLSNFLFFAVLILALTGFLIRTHHIEKSFPLIKKSMLAFANSVFLIFISIFLSYMLLLSIAFLELNVMAITINTNPKILGLQTNTDSVLSTLEKLAIPPKIVTSEKDKHKMLLEIAISSSGNDNLFGANILPSMPGFLVLDIAEPKSSVMMLDDILIFTGVNPEELTKISPRTASLLIQSYFYNRPIKTALKLSVVDIKDYVGFREEGISTRMETVENNSIQNEESIATLSARIEELETTLAASQNFIDSAKEARASNFKECIKTIETPLCQEQRALFDIEVNETKKAVKGIATELKQSIDNLEELEILTDVYVTQENIVDGRREFLKLEQGIFEPPDNIVIPLDNESTRTITDFFTIFIHEYLHYASFISDDAILGSSFFEEGLTEYFSRKILSRRLEASTNLGYPLQIKIVEEIAKSIHDNELEEIYFTKDRELLSTTLDRVYGEGFFSENAKYFEAIQITSDPEQLLKIANLIMKKIGGRALTEEDLKSNFSQN